MLHNRDFCDFVWDTEQAYWLGMYHLLKDELHVRSLVTGTQLSYSPVHIQDQLDYLDAHAYWQHPTFPHRPWDINDWFIDDVAMVNSPGSTMAYLASSRVAGKPYTVSEYNHPFPNSYAAEGFPIIASFGAFQNWDGVFAFAYCHNTNYEARQIEGFFDIKSNTVQLAHMPACAAMFVRGDVAASKRPAVFGFPLHAEQRRLHESHNPWAVTAESLSRDPNFSVLHGTALDTSGRAAVDAGVDVAAEVRQQRASGRFTSDTGEIRWDFSKEDACYYTVDSHRSKLFTGFVRGRSFPLGDVTLKIGKTRLDWATISMTALDGQGFDQPGRILIAATGWTQNQDAKLEKLIDRRVTLRGPWGRPPILCEGVPATITLPVPQARVKFYPLDESGNRRAEIAVAANNGRAQIELGPQHKTVWYEVEIQRQ
jgi:hypothetical protein